IREIDTRVGDVGGVVSAYDFVDWRKQARSFAEMATYDYSSVVLTGQEAPARLGTIFVSAGFFDLLGVAPAVGRTFAPGEDEPGKPPAVVVGYGAWIRYFGGDPAIVGKSIVLDDRVYSVIGVMPAGFGFPYQSVELWCVPGFDLKQRTRAGRGLQALGRLRSGVTVQEAQAEMNTIADALGAEYHQPDIAVRLVPLQDEIVGNARQALLVLWAAVIAVLLIACANVSGLLLARAVSRHKEVAIRRTLGAGRWRLIRQFLTESLMLASIGGLLGLALSYSAGRLVVAASQGAVPRLSGLQIDGRVLVFTAVVCLLSGLLFGLAPALNALGIDLNVSLKDGGAASAGSHRIRMRGALVVLEVAMAMVLLVGGALLAKTLWRLQHVDAGFQADNLLTFRLSVPPAKYSKSPERVRLYQQVAERLAAVPGVDSVGATNDLPFAGSRTSTSFEIDGQPPDPSVVLQADCRRIIPGYFNAMRIKLLSGREMTPHDNAGSALVAVVNQTVVNKFFAGQEPLGQHLKIDGDSLYEIVGIVGDVKHDNLGAPAIPEIYVSYFQFNIQPWAYFVVRSSVGLRPLSIAIRDALKEVAPSLPITGLTPMTRRLEEWMSPQEFNSLLLAVFAGLALILAAIGIYGVVAYSVVQRTREIGIRAALGADRGALVRLILGSGARIGIFGLAVGTVAAYVTTRTLSTMLFGVDPHDPEVFLATAASLGLVIILASYLPARRATRVDPVVALRSE
ncbi:MAG TPA: ABC transporter permease, partial [Blastocatellia bacterium]